MIEDRTRPPRPTPRDWAVFRYGLISEATRPLAHEVVSQTLARVAARQHSLPDGSLHRFSVSTLRAWLRAYQRGGLDALLPRTRADCQPVCLHEREPVAERLHRTRVVRDAPPR